MTTQQENTLGAKLRRAQDLITYLNGFSGYDPPRSEETITELTGLTNSIVEANASVDAQQTAYQIAVDTRQQAFREDENAVLKILSPLRGAVEAQYGKSAKQSAIIAGLIRSMRDSKITKSPADPANDSGISQSQKSFGSITKQFANIVSTLQTFGNYDPSTENLKIESLQQKLQEIDAASHAVAVSVQQLKANRSNRTLLYEDLGERVQRVKSYVRSEYGLQSQEYKLIKGLKV